MEHQDQDRRWERLTGLLEPIHEQAQATARHLCRCPAEGDDLYQEAVLRAFRKLHTLREESRFRSWFFAVLLSIHRSRSRRSFWKRFLPLPDAPAEDAGWIGKDGRDEGEAMLGARRAANALSRLAPEQREAIVLHEIEGFTMDEIAAIQGASRAAVKSRVLRGRERLRKIYATMGVTQRSTGGTRRDPGDRDLNRTERSSTRWLEPLPVPNPHGASPEGGRHD